MKRVFVSVIALVAALLFAIPVHGEELSAPEVSAKAAVLLDATSGAVLYAKNEGEFLSMASTTKIMTGLLAYESGRLDEPMEITAEMVAVEGSSMGLAVGDVITLGELTQGMLAASGNDGANAVAYFLGGDPERFAEMMNARAAALGMSQTHFVTPSGLDAEGHGTTAYDMALLGAAAMEVDGFAEAVREPVQTVDFLSPEKTVYYENHNRLLSEYEGCTGIKTGFTKKSGRCLVTAAERDGARLICVTLNAPDDWDDHEALLDYGFTQFSERSLTADGGTYSVPVVGGAFSDAACVLGEEASANLYSGAQVTEKVILPRFLYAPVTAGEPVGWVAYYCGEKEIARVPLIAAETVTAAADKRSDLEKWFQKQLLRFR